jgi:hypothetical protein
MNHVSLITLALAGVAGVLAALGVDVAGLGGVELVGAGLVLGVVSEAVDRKG